MSSSCLLCSGYLQNDLSFSDLFSFKPLVFPVICKSCEDGFELVDLNSPDQCQACQKIVDGGAEYCSNCLDWLVEYPLDLIGNRAIYRYNDSFRQWLYQYKIQSDARLARVMQGAVDKVKSDYLDYVWIVLPSSPASLNQRGFNQNSLILYEAGVEYQIVMDYVATTPKQAQLTRQERVSAPVRFKIKDGINLEDLGNKFLLFDDLYTTGSTIIKAKNILKNKLEEEGVNNYVIKSLTLARTSDDM